MLTAHKSITAQWIIYVAEIFDPSIKLDFLLEGCKAIIVEYNIAY